MIRHRRLSRAPFELAAWPEQLAIRILPLDPFVNRVRQASLPNLDQGCIRGVGHSAHRQRVELRPVAALGLAMATTQRSQSPHCPDARLTSRSAPDPPPSSQGLRPASSRSASSISIHGSTRDVLALRRSESGVRPAFNGRTERSGEDLELLGLVVRGPAVVPAAAQ